MATTICFILLGGTFIFTFLTTVIIGRGIINITKDILKKITQHNETTNN